MKFMDELDASENEDHSHYQRSENSPEQDFVLIRLRNLEVSEDHYHHKNIVNAQRFLDQICRKEFQRFFFAEVVVDKKVERHRQCNPDGSPDQRFPDLHHVRTAMEDPEIQCEHSQNEQIETTP